MSKTKGYEAMTQFQRVKETSKGKYSLKSVKKCKQTLNFHCLYEFHINLVIINEANPEIYVPKIKFYKYIY